MGGLDEKPWGLGEPSYGYWPSLNAVRVTAPNNWTHFMLGSGDTRVRRDAAQRGGLLSLGAKLEEGVRAKLSDRRGGTFVRGCL